ncbi:hypothetical protein CTI12_AA569950 [Artemisia annua]|uniref:Uncharacterized protein n=1 Tax=Artemisia annua TaxID=35608 RepID=A0A2U1KSC7_ARTAN|nr:hypothetical protein CTI12_AA569950 [Artemisia annua]
MKSGKLSTYTIRGKLSTLTHLGCLVEGLGGRLVDGVGRRLVAGVERPFGGWGWHRGLLRGCGWWWVPWLFLVKREKIVKSVLSYVTEQWLKNHKERFVSAWTNVSFNFNNRTTNRVESQHAKLKRYLKHKKHSLEQFVGCINEIVQSQVTAINESFERSRIFRYHQHNISCFNLLRGFVSNEALDMILGEVHRLNDPEFEYSMCGCQVRKSCGLPCACVLSAYLFSGEYIPLESIDIFWRTLDVSWSKPLEDEDIQCDDDLHIFKENFNKQSNAGKMSFLRKLGCISNPSALLIKEPAVKKNTRGRPSKKQQKKKCADPIIQVPSKSSHSTKFFGVDLNKEPPRHSSYSNYETRARDVSISP